MLVVIWAFVYINSGWYYNLLEYLHHQGFIKKNANGSTKIWTTRRTSTQFAITNDMQGSATSAVIWNMQLGGLLEERNERERERERERGVKAVTVFQCHRPQNMQARTTSAYI